MCNLLDLITSNFVIFLYLFRKYFVLAHSLCKTVSMFAIYHGYRLLSKHTILLFMLIIAADENFHLFM